MDQGQGHRLGRPMRVWIDITNSPHVPFFRPLLRLLAEDGHEVEVTAREFAQTLELLKLSGIEHQVVGPAHGGGRVVGKARAMAGRLPALRRFAKGRRFDLVLAHGSHEAMLVARSLRIPGATAHDYEFATLQHQLGLRAARRVVFPDAVPPERLQRLGARPPKLVQYPGPGGGVLPRGLRARLGRPGGDRLGEGARGRAHAAGRLALPPPREPALRAGARTARPRRGDPRRRAPTYRRAAPGHPRAPPALAARPRARRRRAEPRRARRPRRLGRRHDEPGSRRARHAGLHHVRGPARRRRRGADPSRTADAADVGRRPGRAEARAGRERARAARPALAARPAPVGAEGRPRAGPALVPTPGYGPTILPSTTGATGERAAT